MIFFFYYDIKVEICSLILRVKIYTTFHNNDIFHKFIIVRLLRHIFEKYYNKNLNRIRNVIDFQIYFLIQILYEFTKNSHYVFNINIIRSQR